MKKILVPTDFSNDSYNALHYATQLLASENCMFYILNVYNETVSLRTQRFLSEGGKVLIRQLAEESEEGLAEIVHRIRRDTENKNHSYETISKRGEMLEGIMSSAKELDIDLIVVGNKGKTGPKEMFLGGNTIRTMKTIKNCPILMVPRETEFAPLTEIAFATHYKRDFTANVLDPLRYIANMHNSSINIIHVDEKKELDEEQKANKILLEKELMDIPYETQWRPYYNEKSKVINDFVQDTKVNLLIMINYEHTLLEKMVREPVILDITSQLDIPFLVIPSKD
nr:universal stress protein [Allomuricauda sp.]